MKTHRSKIVLVCLFLGLLGITIRLFYWQIIKGDSLQAIAEGQYQTTQTVAGSRGLIKTADGYTLVGNEKVYRLFVEPPRLKLEPTQLLDQIEPILEQYLPDFQTATESAERKTLAETLRLDLIHKLEDKKDAKWVGLLPLIHEPNKLALEAFQIPGLGFEEYEIRSYPEASMAAQITGFVGKNEYGQDTGYFGIEGALEKELQARVVKENFDSDFNWFNFTKKQALEQATNGRTVVLTIKRDVQYLIETELDKALEQYGAKGGEIVIMEPKTGKIIAAAARPSYDQAHFYDYDPIFYKNPSVSALYEPGSTFKVLTVSAGIENGAITPDTECTACEGPVEIGKYTIKTWNNEYHPNITMTEALEKSDNVAMVFAANKMGEDTFIDAIKRFGLGEQTTNDLQEDRDTPFPQKWGPVELATRSFGQGITVTSLQLIRAIGAIANRGVMMQPQVVDKIVDPATQEEIVVKPKEIRRVVSATTAEQVTKMMISAATHGEAQWIAAKEPPIAGKTGTAQIAVDGKYDPDKTIASFIGFAPPEDPKFIMLVKLIEPSSSPWAAETASPLWFKISHKLFLLLGITPQQPAE